MSDLGKCVSRIVSEIVMIEDKYLELKKTAGKEVVLDALDNALSDIYECYVKLDILFEEEYSKGE